MGAASLRVLVTLVAVRTREPTLLRVTYHVAIKLVSVVAAAKIAPRMGTLETHLRDAQKFRVLTHHMFAVTF